MNMIISNGTVTKLKLAEGALNNFSDNDLETLQYSIWTYSFVNNDQSAIYEITIQDWIDNILKVYSLDCNRTKKMISVLARLN